MCYAFATRSPVLRYAILLPGQDSEAPRSDRRSEPKTAFLPFSNVLCTNSIQRRNQRDNTTRALQSAPGRRAFAFDFVVTETLNP
eukprot:2241367-Rhodomonas_salina.3